MKVPKNHLKQFASTLVQQGWITIEQLREYKNHHSTLSFEAYLIQQGYLTPQQLKTVLKELRLKIYEGRAIGKYKILYKVAQGSMGVIYKVQHQDLQTLYALKLIKTSEDNSEEQVARFQREAQLIAKLKHPNILQIFDYGELEQNHYFVMEYIKEGKTLEKCFQQSIPLKEGIRLFVKILQALHYAHTLGIVHRDLKPANILMTPQGEPKIGDFGLARDYSLELNSAKAPEKSLTFAGQILGTPAYMSPEQASGESILTAQSDIYSMGVCLYEFLTAHCPHEAENLPLLLFRIIAQPITPPSQGHPEVTRDLETIVLKALEKDPSQRYSTAQAFAEDLERYLNHEPVQARRTRAPEKVVKWAKRNTFYTAIFFSFLGILFLIPLTLWGLRYLENTQNFTTVLAKVHYWENQANSVTVDSQKLYPLLQQFSKLTLALNLKPHHSLMQQKKFSLGNTLLAIAFQTQNDTLAEYIAQELEPILTSTQAKTDLRNRILTEKNKKRVQHQKQFQEWSERLKRETPSFELQNEAIQELSQMKEKEMQEPFLTLIQEGKNYFLSTIAPSRKKLQYYITFTLGFGRQGNSASAVFLYTHLQDLFYAMSEKKSIPRTDELEEFMAALAKAIAYSQAVDYTSKVYEFCGKMGSGSLFLKKIRHAYVRLEEKTYLESNSPLTISDSLKRAMVFLRQGNLAETIEVCTLILQKDPNNMNAYLLRGTAKDYQKNYSGAIADYNEAIRLKPQNAPVYINRGVAKRFQGDLLGAIADYNEAIRLKPDLIEAYSNRAIVRKQQGDLEGALNDYTKAIQIQPKTDYVYLNRAEIFYLKRDFLSALQDLSAAKQLNPQLFQIYVLMATIYKEQQKDSDALKIVEELLSIYPQSPEAYTIQGEIQMKRRQFGEALQSYQEALRLNPSHHSAYAGQLYAKWNLGQVQEAQKELQQWIQSLKQELRISTDQELLKQYPEIALLLRTISKSPK